MDEKAINQYLDGLAGKLGISEQEVAELMDFNKANKLPDNDPEEFTSDELATVYGMYEIAILLLDSKGDSKGKTDIFAKLEQDINTPIAKLTPEQSKFAGNMYSRLSNSKTNSRLYKNFREHIGLAILDNKQLVINTTAQTVSLEDSVGFEPKADQEIISLEKVNTLVSKMFYTFDTPEEREDIVAEGIAYRIEHASDKKTLRALYPAVGRYIITHDITGNEKRNADGRAANIYQVFQDKAENLDVSVSSISLLTEKARIQAITDLKISLLGYMKANDATRKDPVTIGWIMDRYLQTAALLKNASYLTEITGLKITQEETGQLE